MPDVLAPQHVWPFGRRAAVLRSPIIVLVDNHKRDAGATSVEYALMASLIAGVIAAAVGVLGQVVVGLFNIQF